MTSENSSRFICSAESQAGASPCDLPDGPMTDLFGLAHVPVNPSRPPAKEQVRPTNGIYGRIGSVSSASASLQSSLAKMLNRRLDGAGSTLFSLTWKMKVTPRGRPYFQLAASARLISGSDCGSWPTTRSTDGDKNVRTAEGSLREMERKGCPQDLNQAAIWASWPTPKADEAGRGGDARRFKGEQSLKGRRSNLIDAAQTASWATPSARDFKSNEGSETFHSARAEQSRGKPLSEQAHQLALGPTATGSPAPMEKRGQLSPAFSRWLMGLPSDWDLAAPSKASRG
jgi:hypothetical protein